MKIEYTAPKVEITELNETDVIACSEWTLPEIGFFAW